MNVRLLLLASAACILLGCSGGDTMSPSDEKTLEQKLSQPVNGAAMNGKTGPKPANPHAPAGAMGGPGAPPK